VLHMDILFGSAFQFCRGRSAIGGARWRKNIADASIEVASILRYPRPRITCFLESLAPHRVPQCIEQRLIEGFGRGGFCRGSFGVGRAFKTQVERSVPLVAHFLGLARVGGKKIE